MVDATLEIQPFVVSFRGFVEPLDEEPMGVTEEGHIQSNASGVRMEVMDGQLEDQDTGETVDVEPGVYVLDGEGFRAETPA